MTATDLFSALKLEIERSCELPEDSVVTVHRFSIHGFSEMAVWVSVRVGRFDTPGDRRSLNICQCDGLISCTDVCGNQEVLKVSLDDPNSLTKLLKAIDGWAARL